MCHPVYGTYVHTICLLVESILFGMFTICILGDQTTVLSTNEAKIDRLKSLSQANGAIEQHHLLNKRLSGVSTATYTMLTDSSTSSNTDSHSPSKSTYPSSLSASNAVSTGSSWNCFRWRFCMWNEWIEDTAYTYHGSRSVGDIESGIILTTLGGDSLDKNSDHQDPLSPSNYQDSDRYADEVNEICGGYMNHGCRCKWFCPVGVNFPPGMIQDRVYGYRRKIKSMVIPESPSSQEDEPLAMDYDAEKSSPSISDSEKKLGYSYVPGGLSEATITSSSSIHHHHHDVVESKDDSERIPLKLAYNQANSSSSNQANDEVRCMA
jgi:hypothetical protein